MNLMKLSKKEIKRYRWMLLIVSFSFVFIQIMPNKFVLAAEVNYEYGRGPSELILINHPDNLNNQPPVSNPISSTLPTNEDLPYYTTYITTTAYTSRAAETDNSPFIAAWGDHVFWGMVASNAFPRGTKIQIPEYYGDKMFIVLDKMNSRYYHRLDIWMPNLNDAKKWGARYVEIKVFK